jgi:hypothetical protein
MADQPLTLTLFEEFERRFSPSKDGAIAAAEIS